MAEEYRDWGEVVGERVGIGVGVTSSVLKTFPGIVPALVKSLPTVKYISLSWIAAAIETAMPVFAGAAAIKGGTMIYNSEWLKGTALLVASGVVLAPYASAAGAPQLQALGTQIAHGIADGTRMIADGLSISQQFRAYVPDITKINMVPFNRTIGMPVLSAAVCAFGGAMIGRHVGCIGGYLVDKGIQVLQALTHR